MTPIFETAEGSDNPTLLPVDRAIALLSKRQNGPVKREQLLELDLSKGQITYRLEVGRLHILFRGVYLVGHPGVTQKGRWSGAVLACGESGALAVRSAGQFRGLVTRYHGPIEVTVGRDDRPHVKGIRTRSTAWGPYDLSLKDNIPVTSLPRTIVDLAGVLSEKELAKAFERALNQNMKPSDVERVLEGHKRKGARRLRKLIARYGNAEGRTRGDFESAFYAWLDEWLPVGYPRPARNVLVDLGDGNMRQADLLFRHANAWIELAFFDHHGASRAQTTDDAQRDREIVAADYKLVHFTSDEFDSERDKVARDLRKLLGL